jgi:hypothetical protein
MPTLSFPLLLRLQPSNFILHNTRRLRLRNELVSTLHHHGLCHPFDLAVWHLAQLDPALSLNVALDLLPRLEHRHRDDGPDDLHPALFAELGVIGLVSFSHLIAFPWLELEPA